MSPIAFSDFWWMSLDRGSKGGLVNIENILHQMICLSEKVILQEQLIVMEGFVVDGQTQENS